MNKLANLLEEKYNDYAISDIPIFLKYLIDESNYKCFIIGADEEGILLFDIIKRKMGIVIDFFVDYNVQFKEYDGVSAYTVEELENSDLIDKRKYIALVASDYYRHDSDYKRNIDDAMTRWGVASIYCAGDMLRPFKRKWTPYYFKSNIEEFIKIYDLLYDDISKDTMYEYLKTYFTGKRYSGKTYPEEYKYWGIEDDAHKIFNIKNGVILNIGAYVGDTAILFIETNIEFEKIIAIEADTETLKKLNMNLSCLPEKYREKVQIDNYFIGESDSGLNVKSIDELYYNENIALINMDIEGAELSALRSGIETIKKHRPILSICAYHRRDDLIELPKFVMQNFEDYTFLLRKYPSVYFYGFDGVQQINELVLYAVPTEAIIQEK